jgi:hypothetical protein
MFSRPITVTGAGIVLRMSLDHARAKPCRILPSRSKNPAGIEAIPKTRV